MKESARYPPEFVAWVASEQIASATRFKSWRGWSLMENYGWLPWLVTPPSLISVNIDLGLIVRCLAPRNEINKYIIKWKITLALQECMGTTTWDS